MEEAQQNPSETSSMRKELSDCVKTCHEEDFLFLFEEEGKRICKATDMSYNDGCKYRSDIQVQIQGSTYYLCNAVKQFTSL